MERSAVLQQHNDSSFEGTGDATWLTSQARQFIDGECSSKVSTTSGYARESKRSNMLRLRGRWVRVDT